MEKLTELRRVSSQPSSHPEWSLDKVSARSSGLPGFWKLSDQPPADSRRGQGVFVHLPALTTGCKHGRCSNCNKRLLDDGEFVRLRGDCLGRRENRFACFLRPFEGRGFNGKTRRKIVTRRIVENYREKDLVLNDYDRCRKFFSRLHIIRKTENKDFIMAPSKVLKIYFYILGILEDIYILEIVLIDRIAFRNFKIYDRKREREE